jgi:hypothetical protein
MGYFKEFPVKMNAYRGDMKEYQKAAVEVLRNLGAIDATLTPTPNGTIGNDKVSIHLAPGRDNMGFMIVTIKIVTYPFLTTTGEESFNCFTVQEMQTMLPIQIKSMLSNFIASRNHS